MPVPATCPHCRASYNLSDALAHRVVRCTVCNQTFAAPVPVALTALHESDSPHPEQKTTYQVWDLKTGRQIGMVHPTIDCHWYNGGDRSFQCPPDGGGWLPGNRLIFDRKSAAFVGDVAPELGGSRDIRDRRLLDREHLSVMVPTRSGPQLRIVTLPGGKPPADGEK
jgi:predicted Zn finger-like uncharacterized protein